MTDAAEVCVVVTIGHAKWRFKDSFEDADTAITYLRFVIESMEHEKHFVEEQAMKRAQPGPPVDDKETMLKKANAASRCIGKPELIAYLEGEELTIFESMMAKCFVCMDYYQDGKHGCGNNYCPMYVHMPYVEE